MAIDVQNTLWVNVCAEFYAQQCLEWIREGRGPADDATSDRFMEEACAVADAALESYKRVGGFGPEDINR
jgi:hypothetical protein